MKCNEIRDVMSLYIDGELDLNLRTEFEEHINSCDDCRYELELLKEMINTLNETEEIPVPQGFHEELMDKINAIQPEQVKPKNNFMQIISQLLTRRFMVPAVTFACLMLVLIISQNQLHLSVQESADKMEMKTANHESSDSVVMMDMAENMEEAPEAPEAPNLAMSQEIRGDSSYGVAAEQKSEEESLEVAKMDSGEVAITFSMPNESLVYSGYADEVLIELGNLEIKNVLITLSEEISEQYDAQQIVEVLDEKYSDLNFYTSSDQITEDYYTIIFAYDNDSENDLISIRVMDNNNELYNEYKVSEENNE